MANSETLTLTLPQPLAFEVRRAVERGDYSDPSDVVAAALSAWIEGGSPPAMRVSRLRELVKEAEESGEEDTDLDLDELIAEARRSSAPER